MKIENRRNQQVQFFLLFFPFLLVFFNFPAL